MPLVYLDCNGAPIEEGSALLKTLDALDRLPHPVEVQTSQKAPRPRKPKSRGLARQILDTRRQPKKVRIDTASYLPRTHSERPSNRRGRPPVQYGNRIPFLLHLIREVGRGSELALDREIDSAEAAAQLTALANQLLNPITTISLIQIVPVEPVGRALNRLDLDDEPTPTDGILPDWLDDIISGALVWSDGKSTAHKLSPFWMRRIVTQLTTISTADVVRLTGLSKRAAQMYVSNATTACELALMHASNLYPLKQVSAQPVATPQVA
jgi:hypothetical protein